MPKISTFKLNLKVRMSISNRFEPKNIDNKPNFEIAYLGETENYLKEPQNVAVSLLHLIFSKKKS